ncbi:hypothetical protein SFK272_0796 [Shigella flexneri K-272]|nr:hypothetical protein SFK272_0796 [Shigella flexneri K-272]
MGRKNKKPTVMSVFYICILVQPFCSHDNRRFRIPPITAP